jgi:exonuclease SbcD
MKLRNFLFVTDIHNRSDRDQPQGRTDSYYLSILAKQEEIGQILIDENIDYLLFGGDLFHKFDAPMGLVNDVASIWKSYKVKRKIGVIGSHDYNGFQIKTLRRTGLGNFVVNGNMEIVSNGKDIFPDNISLDGVFVTGTPHTANLADSAANFFTAIQKSSFIIQMIHGDLFPTPVQWQHQLIDSIHPFIKADLVLSGHIHSGWASPIIKDNANSFSGKTLYVNPGSIGRTENGSPRPIRVFKFTIDVDTLQLVNYEYISLKNVIEHPFVEKIEKIEGSPVADFTGLMEKLSALKLERHDFKHHILHIIKELYGSETDYSKKQIAERVIENIENATL